MENTPTSSSSKTGPKDFFLWFGAIIALYGSISAFIALLFEYINYAFPDVLNSYIDPYGGPIRIAMAGLVVLVPTLLILFWLIRGTILKEPGKAHIWVRRWAIVLTLFIATVAILIDLITLVNTFLGGEITIRFGLKVLVVLLVALGVFLHFLADLKGYWILNPKKTRWVSLAVGILTIVTIAFGFFLIGSPTHVRDLRLDDQRVSELGGIQSQITYYYQTKRVLPKALADLNDPLLGFVVPVDPETGADYVYEVTDKLSFKLCATFSASSTVAQNRTTPVEPTNVSGKPGMGENWQHGIGEVCFTRTIDPEKYPPITSVPTKGL